MSLALMAEPLPLTAEEVKPTERTPSSVPGPWWSTEDSGATTWLTNPQTERDQLWPNLGAPEQDENFKRVKAEDYLAAYLPLGGGFQRVPPETTTIMRNRTPVARQDRQQFDSRRRRPETGYSAEDVTHADLFAETVLVEDQLFLADIWFETAAEAAEFARHARPWLQGPLATRAWLRVGRGGRPVRVERAVWLSAEQPAGWTASPAGEPALAITLTSDLIARSDDLGFLTALRGVDWLRLAGLDDEAAIAGEIEISSKSSKWDTRVVHSFNTAAGARRSAAIALKRGSAFRLEGDEPTLRRLFETLAQRQAQGRGLGERTEEGFGQFALNHPAHLPPQPAPSAGAAGTASGSESVAPRSEAVGEPAGLRVRLAEAEPSRRQQREQILAFVGKTLDGLELRGADGRPAQWGKDFPARSQWQSLRHLVEAAKSLDDLAGTCQTLREHAEHASGRMWAYRVKNNPRLCEALDDGRRHCGDLAEQRLFLSYLCRWVVNQMDRTAEEQ